MDKKTNILSAQNGGSLYEIKVKGNLAPHWSDWMGSLEITNNEKGYACLVGVIPDQSALHGILAQIRDLGLDLILVRLLVVDDEKTKGMDDEFQESSE